MKRILALAAFASLATCSMAVDVTVLENNFTAAEAGTQPANLQVSLSAYTARVKSEAEVGITARPGGDGYVLEFPTPVAGTFRIYPTDYANMANIGNQELSFYSYANFTGVTSEKDLGGFVGVQGATPGTTYDGYGGLYTVKSSWTVAGTSYVPTDRTAFILPRATNTWKATPTAGQPLAKSTATVLDGWNKVTLRMVDGKVSMFVNDVLYCEGNDATWTKGYFNLYAYVAAASFGKFYIDDLKFTALGVSETTSGSLNSTLTPADAITAGAQWSIDGGTTWNDSAVALADKPAGLYTVTYKPVAGYKTPMAQKVSIFADGQSVTANAVYQPAGTVTVTLDQPGAKWSYDSLSWNESGTAVVVPAGNYALSFSGVSGYVTPKASALTVAQNDTLTTSFSYTALPALAKWNTAQFKAFTVPAPTGTYAGTVARAIADSNANIYLGGNPQINAGGTSVLKFAALGGTVPASSSQVSVWPSVTTSYYGLGMDASNNLYALINGTSGVARALNKIKPDGTRDTTWATSGKFNYTTPTDGYQGCVALSDGTAILVPLYESVDYLVLNPNGTVKGSIKTRQPNGTAFSANVLRQVVAREGENGAVTLYVNLAYTGITRLDVNLNDLTRTYTRTLFATPVATSSVSTIFYNKTDNTVVYNDGNSATGSIFVYDADSATLRQPAFAGNVANAGNVLFTQNNSEYMYSINSARSVSVRKREGYVKVTIPASAPAGTKWSVNAGSTYYLSGEVATTFAGETITVRYLKPDGYTKDVVLSQVAPQTSTVLEITPDATTTSFSVSITGTATGQWRFAGETDWRDAGTVTADVFATTIEFKPVDGFVTPPSVMVYGNAAGVTRTGAYYPVANTAWKETSVKATMPGWGVTRLASNGTKLIAAQSTGKTLYHGTIDPATGNVSTWTAFGGLKAGVMGNGYQGLMFGSDGKLYASGDGAAGTAADPAFIFKYNDDFTSDTTFGQNGTALNLGGVYERAARRGAVAVLQNGRPLALGLGHSVAPNDPRYDVVAADGKSETTDVMYLAPYNAASTVRSAAVKYGTATDGSDDIVFIVKDGKILKLTATGGDWTTTPTVDMFFDPGYELSTNVNVQVTYDAQTDSLYLINGQIAANASQTINKLYQIKLADSSVSYLGSFTQTVGETYSSIAVANTASGAYLYVSGTTVGGNYAKVFKAAATVTVNLPSVPANTEWSVDGVTWYPNGTSAVVFANATQVMFRAAGWAAPAPQPITLTQGGTATVVTSDPFIEGGYLQVALNNATGAKWSVNGSTWHDPSESALITTLGPNVISFSGVVGKVAPKSDIVTIVSGESQTLSFTYTDAVTVNNWKKMTSFNLSDVTSGTTMRLVADKDGMMYTGGYGYKAYQNMADTAVMKFAPNKSSVPTTTESLAARYRYDMSPDWTANTNGYLAFAPAADGGIFAGMDGGANTPTFTLKIKADGTTDTAWAVNGVYDYTNAAGLPRYQSSAALSDNTLLLAQLFMAANSNIAVKVLNPDGTAKGDIKISGLTAGELCRNFTVKEGANGAVTLYLLMNYTAIWRVDANLNDLTKTYAAVKFAAPTGATSQGQLFYDKDYNKVLWGCAATNTAYVVDADSGLVEQSIASMTGPVGMISFKDGADEYMYTMNSARVVSVAKREGFVKVTLPAEVPAGAQWSIDGGTTWKNSGEVASWFAGEPINITYKPVTSYATPAVETAAEVAPIVGEVDVTATGVYEPIKADVTVTFNVSDVPAGGWMITEGAPSKTAALKWNVSGYTEPQVPFGQYTVTFKEIAGWTKPADMLVDVNDMAPITVNGVYTKVATLTVTANAPGATWSVNGTDWFAAGTSQDLGMGAYTVQFSDVAGYTKPANIGVTLATDKEVKSVNGDYVQLVGAIVVTINPAEAVAEGAKWMVNGTEYGSGEAALNLAPGTYTVSFKALSNWSVTPTPVNVTVEASKVATASGTYDHGASVIDYSVF